MSYIAFAGDDGDHTLRASTAGYRSDTGDAAGWSAYTEVSPSLAWGDWYFVTEEVRFVDTVSTGPPIPDWEDTPELAGHDDVQFTIRANDGGGSPGSIVWTSDQYTWEAPY